MIDSFSSSGERTRTSDLWVMSPTSCQLLHPAILIVQMYAFFLYLQIFHELFSNKKSFYFLIRRLSILYVVNYFNEFATISQRSSTFPSVTRDIDFLHRGHEVTIDSALHSLNSSPNCIAILNC